MALGSDEGVELTHSNDMYCWHTRSKKAIVVTVKSLKYAQMARNPDLMYI